MRPFREIRGLSPEQSFPLDNLDPATWLPAGIVGFAALLVVLAGMLVQL